MADPVRLPAVADALTELSRADAVARLHARDVSLFGADRAVQESVAGRLGWLDAVKPAPGALQRLERTARAVRSSGITRVLLAGMGGSSLAPEVFSRVLATEKDAPVLEILDSTHPAAVTGAFVPEAMATTLVVVASKSGTTEETRAFGLHAAATVKDSNQLMAITDPGSELEREAFEHRWRDVVLNPPDIGGRFSALSMFGMLPAALAGVDVDQVWARAAAMAGRCGPDVPAESNPGAILGAYMAGCARSGRDKLTLLAAPEVAALGDWIEQLVAESTGKQGRGVVPVVGEPLGAVGCYGQDRAFVELRFAGRPVEGVSELVAAGMPVLTLDLADRHDLGAAFLQWELATAYAGFLLGVNPFDEPNVTESKRNTAAVLEKVVAGTPLPSPGDGDVGALLASVRPGDYVSLQAYVPMTAEVQSVLERVRVLVRDRLGVATTVGFGPRFLHSTGQLHKGGPDSIVALQIVDLPEGGPDIPGRPYDFATLVRAQAAGDLQSLEAHDRRVAQVRVSLDGVERLVEMVAHALS